MTQSEAIDRGREIWGIGLPVPERLDDWWTFTLGDTLHMLDDHGHVACAHPWCRSREAQAARDRIAAGRVTFRRAITGRLGSPEVLHVWRDGRWIATITPSTEGLVVSAAFGRLRVSLADTHATVSIGIGRPKGTPAGPNESGEG